MAKAQTAKPPDIAVSFDLGNDFAVQGRGLTTRLEGKLDIRSTALTAPPRITGEVRTVKGQYRAYGQRLDVETGVARFNGPFDNPALDILAIRPNISQRAGVQITGTAQSPRVRLYSEPTLSDAETLSWVVLGRASATSGGESLLLQQAALALLGGLGKGGTGGGLASRFGLDEIGFKGPGSGGDLRESAVTVGKRISKDFYRHLRAQPVGHARLAVHLLRPDPPPHPARPGRPAERDRPDLHGASTTELVKSQPPFVLVVQWIERGPPKTQIQVRFLSRAPSSP